MNARPLRFEAAALWLALSVSASPAWAAGLSASSASESIGTSIGSLSTSVQKSSESSTGDKKVAAGDYQLIDLTPAPGRPGQMRLAMQAKAGDGGVPETFYLFLPQAALSKTRLQPGEWISARATPYGLEFAQQGAKQAFFLVLEDEVYRELPSRALSV